MCLAGSVRCLKHVQRQRRLPCSSCFAVGSTSAAALSYMSRAATELALLQSTVYHDELVAWLLQQYRPYGQASRDEC